MTHYEFAIKHRQAFNTFCEALGVCPNPHDKHVAYRFRLAVEKKLKVMQANRKTSKPATFALIGPSAGTVEHKGPKAAGIYESHEVPEKHRAFVVDDSGFLVM